MYLTKTTAKNILDYYIHICEKHSKDNISVFESQNAERYFLSEFGLVGMVKKYISNNEIINKISAGKTDQIKILQSMNYLKYKVTKNRGDKRLFFSYLNKYIHLRNFIVSLHYGLVFKWVRSHYKSSVMEEKYRLISEGYMALLEAIDKFDPFRGIQPSTYLSACIMRRFWTRKKRNHLKFLNVDNIDIIEKNEEELYSDEKSLDLMKLNLALNNETLLNITERHIIKQRFSLNSEKIKTLEEIGTELKLSKERVRQLQVKALKKMRLFIEDIPTKTMLNQVNMNQTERFVG